MKYLKFFKNFSFDKKLITEEAAGVPNNIINVAKQILEKFFEKIEDDDTSKTLNKREIEIFGSFQISDIQFKNAILILNIEGGIEECSFRGASMNPSDYRFLDKDLKYKSKKIENPSLRVYLKFRIDPNMRGDEIRKLLPKVRMDGGGESLLVVLSHELMHIYDAIKTPEGSLSDRSDYLANVNTWPKVEGELQEFFYRLYYVSNLENMVRPTEFFAQIEDSGITKKDFLNFIKSKHQVKKLKEIQSFDFKRFYKSELDDLLRINSNRPLEGSPEHDEKKRLYLRIAPLLCVPKLSEEEVTESFNNKLKEYYEIHKQKKISFYVNQLEDLFKRSEITEEFKIKSIENFKKDTEKLFRGDWRKFYEESDKMMKEKATRLLKKIYGLYALVKDDPKNKS